MFIHNINPILVSIGPLEIRWYGLVYVIGFLLVYYVLLKRRNELNLSKDNVESFVLYIVLGTIIGARAFEVLIWNPAYYFSNPSQILAVWRGGLSFHGGALGIFIAVYYFCKKYKVKFLRLLDIITVPGVFALFLGRIANFINGELVGTITSVSWCVQFPYDEGCRHPVQLYGAFGRFILLGYLYFIQQTKKYKDGFIFWNFVLLIGIGRFFVDFLRDNMRLLGLSMGQYLSLAMVVIAGYFLLTRYRK